MRPLASLTLTDAGEDEDHREHGGRDPEGEVLVVASDEPGDLVADNRLRLRQRVRTPRKVEIQHVGAGKVRLQEREEKERKRKRDLKSDPASSVEVEKNHPLIDLVQGVSGVNQGVYQGVNQEISRGLRGKLRGV